MSLNELLLLGLGAVVLAAAVLSIYPGELSWFGVRFHSRLYDASASNYEQKWSRHNYEPYDKVVRDAASHLCQLDRPMVLDLCSGTGRALFEAVKIIGPRGNYTAVDGSENMIRRGQNRAATLDRDTSSGIKFIVADVDTWLADAAPGSFDLITLMEAGEFIPRFPEIFPRIAACIRRGGILVLTYPTTPYALSFPGRRQRRGQMHRLIGAAGMVIQKDMSWRARYRLCMAVKL